MFLDEKRRRVNLSGRSVNQAVDRSALLEQSKKEREARIQSKLRQNSALTIQSHWRRVQSNRASKQVLRSQFDQLLESINQTNQTSTTESATQSTNQSTSQSATTIIQSVYQLIRQFIFFATRGVDETRASSVKALITANLKSKDEKLHFGSSIALQSINLSNNQSNNQRQPHLQILFRRLVQYLLTDLQSTQSVTQSTAASSALLLFSLCNVQLWPNGPANLSIYQTFIMQIFHKVVLNQPIIHSISHSRKNLISWHEACRTRMLDLTCDISLDDQTVTQPAKTAIKNAVALLTVLACLPMETAVKYSAKQSNNQTSNQSIPMSFAQSYIASILTIPLLRTRLLSLSISQSIYQSVWAHHIADQSIKQAMIDPLINHTNQSNNQSSNQFVESLPISSSYSLVDRRPPTPVPMEDSSDSDSDDESIDQSIKISIKQAKEHPRAIHSALWLAANMLDAMPIIQSTDQSINHSTNQLIPALSLLFPTAPASHFPSLSYTIHPSLNKSFDRLIDRVFLNQLIDRLIGHSVDYSIDEVARVCLLIDCLIDRLMNGSAVLSAIAFAPGLCYSLFNTLDRIGLINSYLTSNQSNNQSNNQSVHLSVEQIDSIIQLLCATLSHLLPVMSDVELYGEPNNQSNNQSTSQSPFPVTSIPRLIRFLVAVSYRVYWIEGHQSINQSINRSRVLLARVLTLLRDRQSRKPFTSDQSVSQSMWLMNQLPFSSIQSELMDLDSNNQTVKQSIKHNRAFRLFANLPFVFPFDSRLSYFYNQIDQSRDQSINHSIFAPIKAVIRRSHVLDDGYRSLHSLGSQLRNRIAVEFVDEHGVTERGLDGGGLFREFAGDVIYAAVADEHAFFVTSEAGELAPNPDAIARAPDEVSRRVVLNYYEFIGQMIGKVLYEKLTIGLGGTQNAALHASGEQSNNQSNNRSTNMSSTLTTAREPQFALFFLRKLLEQPATIDDLAAYDPVFYRSLVSLTRMSAAELAVMKLTFTADRQVSRMHGLEYESVPLIPGGQHIEVTPLNVARYVNLTADWRLNRSIHRQCSAFATGLYTVIPRSWLSVFAADELRVLISGKETIDLNDLRANTVYTSGYNANHEVIRWFWDELQHWSHADRAAFLKFVTSVPRAPLTGFQSLQPKFCIQRCDLGESGNNTLPTSATCMNLLRLPRYKTQKQLGERLLYAVRNGLGFGLT